MVGRMRIVFVILLGLVLTGCSKPTVDQGPPMRYLGQLSMDCSEDYIVVFARGSSQPAQLSGQPETLRFFRVIDEVLRSDVRIGYISVDYPATGGLLNNLQAYRSKAASGVYHDSRQAGSRAVADFLKKRTALCDRREKGEGAVGRQRFILGGYSQGAHAMREALFDVGPAVYDRVSYVALFGDPTFRDSALAKGGYKKGAEGIFGGASPQVPGELLKRVETFCDREDFFCGGGGKLSGLVQGQVRDLLKAAVGSSSAHALYPFREMYEAAAHYLERRSFFGVRPRIDIDSGQFSGRFEGVAGCEWSGEVGHSDPGLVLYLTLDVYSDGVETRDSDEIEHLHATLSYDETHGNKRTPVGRAQLVGYGSEGAVRLEHVRWLSGGKGVTPLDIAAEATYQIRDGGPIAGSRKWGSLHTPLSGFQGCFYDLRTAVDGK